MKNKAAIALQYKANVKLIAALIFILYTVYPVRECLSNKDASMIRTVIYQYILAISISITHDVVSQCLHFQTRVYNMWLTWLRLNWFQVGYKERYCPSFPVWEGGKSQKGQIVQEYKGYRIQIIFKSILMPSYGASFIFHMIIKLKTSSVL